MLEFLGTSPIGAPPGNATTMRHYAFAAPGLVYTKTGNTASK
jgi:hypothetical protein